MIVRSALLWLFLIPRVIPEDFNCGSQVVEQVTRMISRSLPSLCWKPSALNDLTAFFQGRCGVCDSIFGAESQPREVSQSAAVLSGMKLV